MHGKNRRCTGRTSGIFAMRFRNSDGAIGLVISCNSVSDMLVISCNSVSDIFGLAADRTAGLLLGRRIAVLVLRFRIFKAATAFFSGTNQNGGSQNNSNRNQNRQRADKPDGKGTQSLFQGVQII
mgnify:CR=1 FL=1